MLGTAPPLRHRCAKGGCVKANHYEEEPSIGEIIAIGLDIAKSVLQIHGVSSDGETVIRKRVGRDRPHGKADASELCEGLFQAQQERPMMLPQSARR
jgi:hypothetical protein